MQLGNTVKKYTPSKRTVTITNHGHTHFEFKTSIWKSSLEIQFENTVCKYTLEIQPENAVWKYILEMHFGNKFWKYSQEIYFFQMWGSTITNHGPGHYQ